VEVWQTSNLRPLRLGEEKKEERKIEITEQKYNGLPYYIGQTIINRPRQLNESYIQTVRAGKSVTLRVIVCLVPDSINSSSDSVTRGHLYIISRAHRI